MAYSSIVKPSDYFNTVLYTGNGGTQTISGVGFQPDFTWVKGRDYAYYHYLQDAIRGSQKILYTNNNDAQATITAGISAWNADGYVTGSQGALNYNGRTFVAWNWKCETGVSGTTTGSGSERSYSGRVNTTAGISIINYAGNSTSGHTIPHNLGATPKIIILKNMGDAGDWIVHVGALNDPEKVLSLNSTAAGTNFNAGFNSTNPTSSVFTLGNSVAVNDDNQQYIAYSFAEKTGYSRFGSYTGNGNADGTFVYTGFKPAFVLAKKTNEANTSWIMLDDKRLTSFNPIEVRTFANLTSAEDDIDADYCDFVSNGFKIRKDDNNINDADDSYIYMAFAENPLVANSGTDGVPATAR